MDKNQVGPLPKLVCLHSVGSCDSSQVLLYVSKQLEEKALSVFLNFYHKEKEKKEKFRGLDI